MYLPKSDRHILAKTIHPLLATRGAPGTHDTRLCIHILKSLQGGVLPVNIPVFDKLADDRSLTQKRTVTASPDIILFEGWCVGIPPEIPDALLRPVNALESAEDADGIWRTYVNDRLLADYADLFSRIDYLIYLQIPSFDKVYAWRKKQEQRLSQAQGQTSRMSDGELHHFIAHYERLTRHAMHTLPQIADTVLKLNEKHRFSG